MGDFRDAAVLALEAFPEPSGKWFFANGQVLPGLPTVWKGAFSCEQPDRRTHLELISAGFDTAPFVDLGLQGSFSGALVLAGRSRARNEWRINMARALVREGAPIIVCGAKTDGIASLKKAFGPPDSSMAKYHATAFVIRGSAEAAIASWVAKAGQWTVPLGGFSADGPDPASQLLVSTIGDTELGHAADLGAGWGYLCASLNGDFHAFEADRMAMNCIRENYPAGVHRWHDVVGEEISETFDSVVMNPPFHQGRKGDPNIGRAFIARAAKILRPRGRLYMVANRHLPYEAELTARFSKWSQLAESGGFKVLEAVR